MRLGVADMHPSLRPDKPGNGPAVEGSMLSEFKKFAVKGNVMDMAVGIIMGGAFGLVVKALVDKVLMPPIGMLMGGVDFKDLKIVLQDAKAAVMENGKEVTAAVPEVAIEYGSFLNTIINFLIVAFSIFVVVKIMNKAKKREEEKPAAPPKQEVLLEEIRDLLAKQS